MDRVKKFARDHKAELTGVAIGMLFCGANVLVYRKGMQGMVIHGAEVHQYSDGTDFLVMQTKNGKMQYLPKLAETITAAAA